MADVTVKIDEKNKTVTCTLPLIHKVSSSGKSILIASTKGTRVIDGVTHKGKDVEANVNITIENDGYSPSAPTKG